MKWYRTEPIAVTVDATAPANAGDGVAIPGADHERPRELRGLVTLTVPADTDLDVILYGRVAGVWGMLCDVGNRDAKLGGSSDTTIGEGVYHFEFAHVEGLTRLALVEANKTGTGEVTASLLLFEERP